MSGDAMSATSSHKVTINKRVRGLPREALEKLSKSELIDKIVQLEAYNFQLKNILQKKLSYKSGDDSEVQNAACKSDGSKACKPTKKRDFDWSSAHKRHVLLKLLYFGWDYQGYACQEDSNKTIEYHLFQALERTCLIESRATSNYHRCGRTDKEVSAFCQVVSIDLRSKLDEGAQHDAVALQNEIDYCGLLNRVLPKNIQCIAWMPLHSPLYSARFDCVARTYRYYFPKGNLNIEVMQAACQLLVRHADFRNFCKMDVHNGVTNYIRNLIAASVAICPGDLEHDTGYTMYYLEIKANAFLWHQIRCIMAVLLLIGQGKEQPSVISDLLDVATNPCKPQYTPAIGLPLNLFHCDFRAHTTRKSNYKPDTTECQDIAGSHDSEFLFDENAEIETKSEVNADAEATPQMLDTSMWIYNNENLQKLIEHVQCQWTEFSIKCTMIRNVLHTLETLLAAKFKEPPLSSQVLLLQESVKPRQYQKLLQRKRCESLENRIDHFVKKQRLVMQRNE